MTLPVPQMYRRATCTTPCPRLALSHDSKPFACRADAIRGLAACNKLYPALTCIPQRGAHLGGCDAVPGGYGLHCSVVQHRAALEPLAQVLRAEARVRHVLDALRLAEAQHCRVLREEVRVPLHDCRRHLCPGLQPDELLQAEVADACTECITSLHA
jgi:hypothetical protein